jgi:purine-nucleoside/S-methyl-5'-thioadenosine phosphorylase / adenosine deaminase
MTELAQPVDWPAPRRVHACVSRRSGGVSEGGYASLNLAAHVGDEPERVAENRRRLAASLGLPSEPAWLEQVHGTRVVDPDRSAAGPADGAVTGERGRVLAVLTADCVPVLVADREGRRVGVAHAGWRGLAAGILPAVVGAMGVPGVRLIAWLGPAISAPAYEVGAEVRAAFVDANPAAAGAFRPGSAGRWHADLYALARASLAGAGVTAVGGGGECTFASESTFFSHRREAPCGRMASLIWLD